MLKMADVIVKDSKIHGKGVFAARDFKKGEMVIDWSACSVQLTKEQVDKLPKSKKRYVSFLKGRQYVLFTFPGKCVNHSCDSNTKAQNGKDIAVRNIKKGEEITADYILERVPELDMRCKCGSKNCKEILKIK